MSKRSDYFSSAVNQQRGEQPWAIGGVKQVILRRVGNGGDSSESSFVILGASWVQVSSLSVSKALCFLMQWCHRAMR